VRVTLVSRELHTPYSGILIEGCCRDIAGHYGCDDMHPAFHSGLAGPARRIARAIHAAVGRGRRWGGVELALAVHHALGPAAVRNGLVTAAARLLEGHARRVQQRLETVLASGGIDVRTDFKPA